MTINQEDSIFYKIALEEAKKGLKEKGIPVGAILVKDGVIISKGHNQRIQQNNPIAHGEMVCIRDAGRQENYKRMTLYTTLSPCLMCAGTIIQFKIPRVLIGENHNFKGNIDFLKQNGVEVVLLNDKESINIMTNFIKDNPQLWYEDIAEK